jgi:hypothetical protein
VSTIELSPEQWRKSSYSNASGSCVEVGRTPGRVVVRDTTDRDGGMLAVSPAAWQVFTSAIRTTESL